MGSPSPLTRPRTTANPSLGANTVPQLLARHADRLRGPFLDALPIAGAIVGLEGESFDLIGANAAFVSLGGGDFIRRCGFGPELKTFLRGKKPVLDFDWLDGDAVTGRCYTVRIARVALIEGVGPRCLITLLDRTAERATEQSLRREMFTDSLTGLPNRAGFSEQLDRALEGGETGRVAVLLIDLTRFSRVNESIGPLAGDELLITVARRLLSALRKGDVLARIGGNEFGIFLAIKDGTQEALAAAQRAAAVLSTPCRLSELEIRIGCAIGCAVHEADCDGDELIRRAQFALKQAKSTGDTEVYQPRAHDLARHQFSIETALRRAIEADRLTLAFQPVIDLSTGAVSGFEALARWQEDGEPISPATFIPVAEESGLIVPLGRWAIEAALRTLAEWDARGLRTDSHVAVNVSALQIARDDLPRLVSDALGVRGIAPGRLTLELTESAFVAEPERAARAMHEVREIGAALALDDFGTGFSSLAYLQRLPLDVLKIDQSFVTGMLGDRDKVAIVRAILSLADALGLKTTAEGVETEQLAHTLAALGCNRAQGYFYARPLEADAAYEFWARSSSSAT